MNTTPRTDAARGFHDMDTAVSAEDMAQLETELIYLREENKLLKAAQKISEETDEPIITELIYLREENKLLKAAQKISEERDEQLIQEARSLQSLGAILAAYDVSVKTRKRLETELTEAKANFKEERTFLIAEIKEQMRELATEYKKVRMLTNNLRALITAVTYADPPKLFNGVLCHEARVPVEFVDSSREALATTKEEGK